MRASPGPDACLQGAEPSLAPAADTVYRHVYIVESRRWWREPPADYDPARDLVLTYDFGLRREILRAGGTVRYLDHLCDSAVMQENNFRMYRFFRDWHGDAAGEDIFRFRDVPFGFAFRIEIWNDFTFHVRLRLCLEALRPLVGGRLFVGCGDERLGAVLDEMGLGHEPLSVSPDPAAAEYFFPIHRWMDEKLRTRRWRHVLRDVFTLCQGTAAGWLDRLQSLWRPLAYVYVQEYHPTRRLLQRLKGQPGVRVLQGHYSADGGWRKYLLERPIPVRGRLTAYRERADELLRQFRLRRSASLVLTDGTDITTSVYRVIEARIAEVLPGMLRSLDCAVRYLDRHPLRLEILIGNVGQMAMLVDAVARSRGVPSFLIINGILGNAYLDEGKYATIINGYSESIRDNYFAGMKNVVCLGDPRMDGYGRTAQKLIDRDCPTITIGASGFNNIDLNSYLAVEFEFLDDVLSAIRTVREGGRRCKVVLKVRANGYSHLYRRFLEEYWPGAVEAVLDQQPMKTVLEAADFYISIYSQTLFEASCLGIPCVYHKTDNEVMDPPFDGKSELVTSFDVAGLVAAINDFYDGHSRYRPFLERSVMEKYIGPLDGGNLERNMRFVDQLLSGGVPREICQ